MTHIEKLAKSREICPQCDTELVRYLIDSKYKMCATCAILTAKHRHENDIVKMIEEDCIQPD